MVTHGPDDPDRASIPFAMAVAAQSAGIEVVMGFQVDGALLLKKGVADGIAATGFVPLKELMDIYRTYGGRFLACGPCVAARHIMPDDFIEGATVVNAPTFVEHFITANNVLVY